MLKGADFVTSNVPGAPFPIYSGGAELERMYAFGPLSGAAVNVTLLSHCGIVLHRREPRRGCGPRPRGVRALPRGGVRRRRRRRRPLSPSGSALADRRVHRIVRSVAVRSADRGPTLGHDELGCRHAGRAARVPRPARPGRRRGRHGIEAVRVVPAAGQERPDRPGVRSCPAVAAGATTPSPATSRAGRHAAYTLRVGGLVDRPFTMTYDELRALPPTRLDRDFQCVTGWRVAGREVAGRAPRRPAGPRRRAGRGHGAALHAASTVRTPRASRWTRPAVRT